MYAVTKNIFKKRLHEGVLQVLKNASTPFNFILNLPIQSMAGHCVDPGYKNIFFLEHGHFVNN